MFDIILTIYYMMLTVDGEVYSVRAVWSLQHGRSHHLPPDLRPRGEPQSNQRDL